MSEPLRERRFDLCHALDVAARVDGLEAKVTALLHDAVEDGLCTLADLRDADMPPQVVDAVGRLTRLKGEGYGLYIERIKASRDDLAIYVKLADLEANLARRDEEHASLTARYLNASRVLRGVA